MTSIIKKVFRGSTKKNKKANGDGRLLSAPVNPPSPDLSALTADELSVLKDVFRRQEAFESEVGDRQQKLRDSLLTYEDEVKRHASQKSKLKHVDLRLCRLCYKTKFADGIGRACYDCNKRVCNRCGSFSKSTWNAKKQKTVKGKWRCTMCQMKRDVVAMTGVWYHGNEKHPTRPTTKLQSKISSSDLESSDYDGTMRVSGDMAYVEAERHGDVDDCDVFSDDTNFATCKRSCRRSSSQRRRSLSKSVDVTIDDPDVENVIDVEQFQRERHLSRRQRQNKYRRRSRTGSFKDWIKSPRDTDVPVSSGDNFTYEGSSSTERYMSSDRDHMTNSDSSPCHERSYRRHIGETRLHVDQRRNDAYIAHTRVDDLVRDEIGAFHSRSLKGSRSHRSKHNRRDSGGGVRVTDRRTAQSLRSRSLEANKSDENSQSNGPRVKIYADDIQSDRKTHGALRNQNEMVPCSEHSSTYVKEKLAHAQSLPNVERESRFSRESQHSKDVRHSRESRFLHDSKVSCNSRASQDSRVSRESRSFRDSDQVGDPETRVVRLSRGSCTSYDSTIDSPTFKSLKETRRKLVKQDEVAYSSSSSVFSESRHYITAEHIKHDISPSKNPVTRGTLRDSPRDSTRDIENIFVSHKLHNSRKSLQSPRISTNSLSPDMALYRNNRRGRKSEPSSSHRSRPGSVSPQSPRHAGPDPRDISIAKVRHQRRNTLPYCTNIEQKITASDDKFSVTSPREIILHRNAADKSIRTQGLGMRIVGGRKGPKGALGAFVTMVTKGGPADMKGVEEGDQIVEWNGRCMADVTFEEAQNIVNMSGDIVQLSVIRCPVERENSPITGDRYPIIIRSDIWPDNDVILPGSLILGRPKRRMLPKTPVEIKRNVKRISGRIWMQLDYDVTCQCLLVVVLRGEGILSEAGEDRRGPNALVMLHLLPSRALYEAKESEIRYATKDPQWNETFIFANIEQFERTSAHSDDRDLGIVFINTLGHLALEMTMWNYKEVEDEFLGEVLLDLGEAHIDNSVQCYNLEDHDENSSPLPYRKKSFSLSDSAISPVTSTSSAYPSRDPSPRSSVSTKDCTLSKQLILHDKKKKRSPGREKIELSSSAQSSPMHSPTSTEYPMNNSLTSLVKRKIGVVARMSNTLGLGPKRDSGGGDIILGDVIPFLYGGLTKILDPLLLEFNNIPQNSIAQVMRNASDPTDTGTESLKRSQSETDVREPALLNTGPSPQPRRSLGHRHRFELLAPPHPQNGSNNSSQFFDDVSSDTDVPKSPNPDRPAPEGDDITSLLGPGQITPKPSYETSVCGDIKMGFMVSKGQLEIDIVVVKGLAKSGLHNPPDTYVKTYLVEGSKTVQKKKTQTIRMSFDPIFRKKIKYSACNIHGRCIKVNVWDKQKTFDRKQCLGEAVVKLDSLDLSQHTMAWYKLFPVGATEICSSESLNDWPY